MPPGLLDELLAKLDAMPAGQRAEIEALARKHVETVPWVPTPGPQTEAYFSKADILFYGGAAGGGKSSLLLGLAFTSHQRTLVLRRQYTDLSALTEYAIAINKTRKGFNGSSPPKLVTRDGRRIDFGACHSLGDEQNFQGQPHDLLCVDEAPQVAESQFRFLMTWLRSTEPKQRCRAVLAGNPPVTAEGEWLIRFFAPWLDPTHHNPAAPGELRWYVTDEEGKDREVPGPASVIVGSNVVKPLSRTFIPAKLGDNPFLSRTDYAAKLDALPEPFRSAFRDGNFQLTRKDAQNQLIPLQWIREAQSRWSPHPPNAIPMCAIGVDPSGGGGDEYVLAPRHDSWFAIPVRAKKVRTGPEGAGLIVSHRRGDAVVIIDMGGGYGGSTYDHLVSNSFMPGQNLFSFKGAESSTARTADGLLGFFNKRSEAYWKFREALDPSQPGGSPVALPPDPALVSDLTAVNFTVGTRGIQAEPKEDVVTKLGRSPDAGDAIVISWCEGARALTHAAQWKKEMGSVINKPVIRSRQAAREFLRR